MKSSASDARQQGENVERARPPSPRDASNVTIDDEEQRDVPAELAAFDRRAAELAAWAWRQIVNRPDAYGQYVAVEKRSDPTRTATTKKVAAGDLPLDELMLARHFRGVSTGDLLGLHSGIRREVERPVGGEVDITCTTLWAAIDIDRHGDSVDREMVEKAASTIHDRLAAQGFSPLWLDSNGIGGSHLIVLFAEPMPLSDVHYSLKAIVGDYRKLGLKEDPEVFPKQVEIPEGGFGNWLRLAGRHHTRDHCTRVRDGSRWLAGEDAVDAILQARLHEPGLITPELARPPKPKAREKTRRLSKDLNREMDLALQALDLYPNVERYPDWIEIGMCLHHKFGPAGLALWVKWSEKSSSFDIDECEHKWKTFGRSSVAVVTIGTLFEKAKPYGFKFTEEWHSPKRAGSRARQAARTEAAEAVEEARAEVKATPTFGVYRGPTDEVEPKVRPKRPLTDLGNSERFIDQHGDDVRYCYPWKSWMVWDGRRWEEDAGGRAVEKAKLTTRAILKEAADEPDEGRRKSLTSHAAATEERARINAMVELAKSAIPIKPGDLDRDPWALNVSNGTIDLRTGILRSHRKEDYNSKVCPVAYDPAAKCPLWLQTLNLFFDGDQELIEYFQRLCGYALTGVVHDHILPIAHGKGANGKSTILETLIRMLGTDYAMKAPKDMLMLKKHEPHPTEQATLFGKRLVIAVESAAGKKLDETLVKALTGNDTISARRMHENFWDFQPTHKLILATNHKPEITGTDHGIWRRIKYLPFRITVKGGKADTKVPDRLQAELPGILAWCVGGCLAWQRRNLDDEPAIVREATEEYRAEQDRLGTFLETFTTTGTGHKVEASRLYKKYKDWASGEGEVDEPLTQTMFGRQLSEMGFTKRKNGTYFYHGIGLASSKGVADGNPDGGEIEPGETIVEGSV